MKLKFHSVQAMAAVETPDRIINRNLNTIHQLKTMDVYKHFCPCSPKFLYPVATLQLLVRHSIHFSKSPICHSNGNHAPQIDRKICEECPTEIHGISFKIANVKCLKYLMMAIKDKIQDSTVYTYIHTYI